MILIAGKSTFVKLLIECVITCSWKSWNKWGVHSDMLGWLESYLHDRIQYVKVLGWNSHLFSVGSGVPQGSHLGSLLFLLFIDDVTKYSKCSLYADELKLFKKIQTVLDSSSLQRDLDALYRWFKYHSLNLNVGKCSVISFYRIRQPIICGYAIGYLFGTDEAYQSPWCLFWWELELQIPRWLHCFEDLCKVGFYETYFAHVRSHLEYAAAIWFPLYSSYRGRIESVQKQFLIYALLWSMWRESEYRLPF